MGSRQVRIDLFAEDDYGSDNVKSVVASLLGAGDPHRLVSWTFEGTRTYRSSRIKKGPRSFGKTPRQFHGWGTRPGVKVAGNAWLARSIDVQAVIVASDIDRKEDRWLTPEERERFLSLTPPLILAEMNPEAEAWRIVMFAPTMEIEAKRLTELRKDLSFDPQSEPERMHSTSDRNSDRDSKKVAARLFDGDSTAGLRYLDCEPTAMLACAASSGLPQFVSDMRSYLSKAQLTQSPR